VHFSLAPSLLPVLQSRQFDGEDHPMATETKASNFVHVQRVERFLGEIKTSEAVRIGQYNFLSEMVGLSFGLMTLGWIISSLFALP
jgi:hypothetical protein